MTLFPSFFVNKTGGYEIEQSLRFNSGDTHYLNRTPGSAGNRRTWTWSGWFKRTDVSAGTGNFTVFAAQQPSGPDQDGLVIDADGSFYILFYSSDPGGSNVLYYRSDRQLRDPSAWYHIMFVLDTTQAAVDDRCNVWINNEKVVDINTANRSALSQNFEAAINNTGPHTIGKSVHTSDPGDGYLAEVNFIDGTAYTDATAFGEYDDNGVWRPIKYTGSYTGQSWYLKFASGDGTDSSGLSNDWTANNFTTSGTGTDVMSDTPTTNWCTWNPLKVGTSTTLSEGNLYFTFAPTDHRLVTSTFAVSSGKWYWEGTYNAGSIPGSSGFGIAKDTINLNSSGGQTGIYVYHSNGQKYLDGVNYSYGATYTTNDIIGIAFDADNGTLTGYKNGTSQGTITTGLTSGPYFLLGNSYANSSWTLNCGQRAFAYTPPTGFKPLNTSNLSAPTVKDGSKNFNTVLYTGNGTSASSTQAITGVGFQPDFLWVKGRSVTSGAVVWDAIRGADKFLFTHNTNAEDTTSDWLSSFDTDGFTAKGDANNVNATGQTFVAWNWLAGGSGSSNTDGSITSTVSANPSAGFSIVSYTGTGSAATVGHGLGVPPAFMVLKCRNKSFGWTIYHQSLGNTRHLDFTSGTGYTGDAWNSTNPTSTVFSIGTDAGSNNGSSPPNNYVAYCFAEVEGYSKFGSYVGNGSSDGPFVYCGFKPAWIMVKRSNAAQGWYISDNKRDTYNQVNRALFANTSDAESTASTGASYDFLSNGFKPRTSNNDSNGSGDTYVFMAFASNPFGGEGVSPATAR